MPSRPLPPPRLRLETLADRIPDRYRLPTMLHCIHGMETDEIARTLEVPVGKVRFRVAEGIHRLDRLMRADPGGGPARKALREAVREAGVIAPPPRISARDLYARGAAFAGDSPRITVRALLGDSPPGSLWGGACRRLRAGLNRMVHALPATLL